MAQRAVRRVDQAGHAVLRERALSVLRRGGWWQRVTLRGELGVAKASLQRCLAQLAREGLVELHTNLVRLAPAADAQPVRS